MSNATADERSNLLRAAGGSARKTRQSHVNRKPGGEDSSDKTETEEKSSRADRERSGKAKSQQTRPVDRGTEDMCYCVYCAFSRLLKSGYFCAGCMCLILVTTSIAAILALTRDHMHVPEKKPGPYTCPKETERVRRIAAMNGRNPWETDREKPGIMESLYSLTDMGYGSSGMREQNVPVESGIGVNGELAGIQFDMSSVSGDDSSERLRNFYKKLMKTDAQIRKLKMSLIDPVNSANPANSPTESQQKMRHARMKRSLQDKPIIYSGDTASNNEESENIRKERSDNDTEPTSIVFENKKLFVQIVPKKEAIKNTNAFLSPLLTLTQIDDDKKDYKHSQKFDKLLDQVLEEKTEMLKNLDLPIENLYAIDNEMTKSRPSEVSGMQKPIKVLDEADILNNDSKLTMTENFGLPTTINDDVTSRYDVFISISQFGDILEESVTTEKGKMFQGRKLLQSEEKGEEEMYEDDKELLSNDLCGQDESYQFDGKMKRNDAFNAQNKFKYGTRQENIHGQPVSYLDDEKYDPLNYDWKETMPLYSDEVTASAEILSIKDPRPLYRNDGRTVAKAVVKKDQQPLYPDEDEPVSKTVPKESVTPLYPDREKFALKQLVKKSLTPTCQITMKQVVKKGIAQQSPDEEKATEKQLVKMDITPLHPDKEKFAFRQFFSKGLTPSYSDNEKHSSKQLVKKATMTLSRDEEKTIPKKNVKNEPMPKRNKYVDTSGGKILRGKKAGRRRNVFENIQTSHRLNKEEVDESEDQKAEVGQLTDDGGPVNNRNKLRNSDVIKLEETDGLVNHMNNPENIRQNELHDIVQNKANNDLTNLHNKVIDTPNVKYSDQYNKDSNDFEEQEAGVVDFAERGGIVNNMYNPKKIDNIHNPEKIGQYRGENKNNLHSKMSNTAKYKHSGQPNKEDLFNFEEQKAEVAHLAEVGGLVNNLRDSKNFDNRQTDSKSIRQYAENNYVNNLHNKIIETKNDQYLDPYNKEDRDNFGKHNIVKLAETGGIVNEINNPKKLNGGQKELQNVGQYITNNDIKSLQNKIVDRSNLKYSGRNLIDNENLFEFEEQKGRVVKLTESGDLVTNINIPRKFDNVQKINENKEYYGANNDMDHFHNEIIDNTDDKYSGQYYNKDLDNFEGWNAGVVELAETEGYYANNLNNLKNSDKIQKYPQNGQNRENNEVYMSSTGANYFEQYNREHTDSFEEQKAGDAALIESRSLVNNPSRININKLYNNVFDKMDTDANNFDQHNSEDKNSIKEQKVKDVELADSGGLATHISSYKNYKNRYKASKYRRNNSVANLQGQMTETTNSKLEDKKAGVAEVSDSGKLPNNVDTRNHKNSNNRQNEYVNVEQYRTSADKNNLQKKGVDFDDSKLLDQYNNKNEDYFEGKEFENVELADNGSLMNNVNNLKNLNTRDDTSPNVGHYKANNNKLRSKMFDITRAQLTDEKNKKDADNCEENINEIVQLADSGTLVSKLNNPYRFDNGQKESGNVERNREKNYINDSKRNTDISSSKVKNNAQYQDEMNFNDNGLEEDNDANNDYDNLVYMEEYSGNGDTLAKAQAYSDYGVLESKKGQSGNDNHQAVNDKADERIRMSPTEKRWSRNEMDMEPSSKSEEEMSLVKLEETSPKQSAVSEFLHEITNHIKFTKDAAKTELMSKDSPSDKKEEDHYDDSAVQETTSKMNRKKVSEPDNGAEETGSKVLATLSDKDRKIRRIRNKGNRFDDFYSLGVVKRSLKMYSDENNTKSDDVKVSKEIANLTSTNFHITDNQSVSPQTAIKVGKRDKKTKKSRIAESSFNPEITGIRQTKTRQDKTTRKDTLRNLEKFNDNSTDSTGRFNLKNLIRFFIRIL